MTDANEIAKKMHGGSTSDNSSGGAGSDDTIWYGSEMYDGDAFFDTVFGGMPDDPETLDDPELSDNTETLDDPELSGTTEMPKALEKMLECQPCKQPTKDKKECAQLKCSQPKKDETHDESSEDDTHDEPREQDEFVGGTLGGKASSIWDFAKTVRRPSITIGGLPGQTETKQTEPAQTAFQKELQQKAAAIGGSKRANNIEECSEKVAATIRKFGAGLKL